MKLLLVILTAVLAVAVPAAAATPDRENALAFENATLLIANGGEYRSGVQKWSAWCLTDGDEKLGWCSPQGKPTGLAFVWDLDTSWSLETLALSTRKMQERGYLGISAKRIDLYAGDGKNFVKVGAFTVGKEERKEYPLPKGTVARQVKVVVTGNHGHKEFTEIAEIEFFGARTGTTAAT